MPLRPRKAVQIVGAAPTIATDPVIEGAERWLFNASYLADGGRPYTRVFNLHDAKMGRAIQPVAWDWYAQQSCPVYLIRPLPEIPQSVRFPFEEIQAFFANENRNGEQEEEQCFNCSVDFMIALALMEGFEQIDLMGIEALSEEEYRDQRASIMYWMGRGRGMGRVVTASFSSGLCRVPAIYGYNLVTGAPCPPGQVRQWLKGHPHSTWPPPSDWKDPILFARTPVMHEDAR